MQGIKDQVDYKPGVRWSLYYKMSPRPCSTDSHHVDTHGTHLRARTQTYVVARTRVHYIKFKIECPTIYTRKVEIIVILFYFTSAQTELSFFIAYTLFTQGSLSSYRPSSIG